jgi:hypothetical protein
VSNRGVKVSDLDDLADVATVALPADDAYWILGGEPIALPEPAVAVP